MLPYTDFLARKVVSAKPAGFAVNDLHSALFPWQKQPVEWALKLGRAALFEERGLGKTIQQAEWARNIVGYTNGGRVMIICPLAVAHQTIHEAQALLNVPITYVRSQAELLAAPTAITITNYDMVIREAFDPSVLVGVVLDESSKLKTFNSRTKQYLIEACQSIPYRLCATATPSPNDTTELGNHAEFLGVMSSGEMLTRWFVRDSNDANNLRLKGHAVKDFWRWVTSWAVCINKPSDLGPEYSDEGYDLPPITFHHEIIPVSQERAFESGRLYADTNHSAIEAWQEKSVTLTDRVQRVKEIVEQGGDDFHIIWHDTDYERDEIKRKIPSATIVTGSQDPDEKERLLSAFTDGSVKVMATKPKIGGWGLNWQHCNRMIFAGLTHKFEEWYQAIGRCHRFHQSRGVHVYMVYAESEAGIVDTLNTKRLKHEAMHREMVEAMREHGLGALYQTNLSLINGQPIRLPKWLN